MELPIPGLILREDGTIDRSRFDSSFVPANEDAASQAVVTRDVALDHGLGTWVRIFLPKEQLDASRKVPVVLYFHGGGFVILSAGSKPFHGICSTMASRFQVMVVSVEYRLAPEHRLPAAFEDAWASLLWLVRGDGTSEPWLRDHGDVTSCFLMGHSAGGTIVNRLAHQAVASGISQVRGVISCVPGFAGEQASGSEVRFDKRDHFLTLECLRWIWKLALPENSTRDHPLVSVSGVEWGTLPPVLLVVADCDPLIDRQLEFGKALERGGTAVTLVVCKGYTHSEALWPFLADETDAHIAKLREFICGRFEC